MFTRVMRVMLAVMLMMPLLLFAGDQKNTVYGVNGKVASVDSSHQVIVVQGNSYYIPRSVSIMLEDGTVGSITDIQADYTIGCRYRVLPGDGNVVVSIRRISNDPSYVLPQL